MAGVTTRGGKVLLSRVGPLQATRQGWDRAPASRGMWAFPWPAFDWWFASHRRTELLPKRLTDDAIAATSDAAAAAALRAEQVRWLTEVGPKVAARRTFWSAGPFFAHVTPDGGVLALDDWHFFASAGDLAAAIRRTGGPKAGRYDVTGATVTPDRSVDHLEVFLPARNARLRTR